MESGWNPRAVVVGSGLAGLGCALDLAAGGWQVVVVSPGRAGRDGATHRVHALAPWVLLTAPWVRGDSPERFLQDLKERGRGLERDGLAEVLATEAHPAARELIEMLDLEPMEPGPIPLPGDAQPRGMRCIPRRRNVLLAPLLARCTQAGVRFRERTVVGGLRVGNGRAAGVAALDRTSGELAEIASDVVVLACGGSGRVFPVSTSPRWCRGSGLALASAVGALLHRPGLTQALPVTATPPLHFFPTSAALLAGAIEVDGAMLPAALNLEELTLAIARALRRGGSVFLEPVEQALALLPERVRTCAAFRSHGRVPLTVAAHHGIGGVAIDIWGRTSLPGLYACGEAAGGVQGQRRTMGTGLIEALIFGRRVARTAQHDGPKIGPSPTSAEVTMPPIPDEPAEFEKRLDALLGPLVAWRPTEAVAFALGEVRRWSVAVGREVDEGGALAALRRQAAVAVLQGSPASAAREGPVGRDVAV